VVFLLVSSCATYYQLNYDFNNSFERGDMQQARQYLASNKKAADGKERFLYWLNMGTVNSLLGNYDTSNYFFEKAYIFGEDHHKNALNQAASFLTNPNVTVYPGEDHEHLILLYYKALNYLKMGRYDEALVECRRMDIRQRQLATKYESEYKFKQDAFIHVVMGIAYQAKKDYNNAYIAYKNALEVYEKEYSEMFNMAAPEQLKYDLLHTARLSGFYDELAQWENKFGLKYSPPDQEAELVFFWHNGLSPVKSEWSVNFVIVRGEGGMVYFKNDKYDFAFPYFLGDHPDERADLGDMEMIRVAFPKYVERPILYDQAFIEKTNGTHYQFSKGEDINDVAFYVLEQRMIAEFGKALLRLAVKKSMEYAFRENDEEGWAAAISMINAATEKADTRNWQTMPHDINYTRVPLEEGQNQLVFRAQSHLSSNVEENIDLLFTAEKGQTIFHSLHTIDTAPTYTSGY
jgi:hypothetical protein